MTLRELLKKPYWSPMDLSRATGISITTARDRLTIIREELSAQGYINIDKSRAPTKNIIERLNIDIEFLEKIGSLDEEIIE